jgi:hypothetical protein
VLTALTLSCLLIALGVLAAVDVSGAKPPNGAYVATALTVVGLGLLVGSWFGRARGLVWVGVILSVVTLAATAASPWDGRNGGEEAVDVRLRPASVAELPVGGDYGVGSVVYDLRDVDFTGHSAAIKAEIGLGELVVTVPADVDVTVRAQTGVGGLTVFGRNSGGFGNDREVTDVGADGPGGGQLDLDLSTGLGNLEVRREKA